MTPEGKLKAAVLKKLEPLEAMGRIKVERMQSGTRGGGKMRLCSAGTPDLLVMLRDGEVIWLELKRPDVSEKRGAQGKTRIAQAAWRASADRLGHKVYVITNADHAVSAVLGERD